MAATSSPAAPTTTVMPAAAAGVQQPDGALDEGRVVRVTADEGLGTAHPSTGAGGEDEPADVRGSPVHRSWVGCALTLAHIRNVPEERLTFT